MKKGWLLLLTAMLLTSCAACGERDSSQTNPPAPVDLPAAGSQGPEPWETGGEYLSMGDSAALGCWEITVTSFEFTEQLNAGETSLLAEPSAEGGPYGLAAVTVVRTGKEAGSLLSPFAAWKASLLYQGKYELGPTPFSGMDASSEVLDSKSGYIPFALPNTVADSEDTLLLCLSLGQATAVYRIR